MTGSAFESVDVLCVDVSLFQCGGGSGGRSGIGIALQSACGAARRIWVLMVSSRRNHGFWLWELLGGSGAHLGASGALWGPLSPSGGLWGSLGASGGALGLCSGASGGLGAQTQTFETTCKMRVPGRPDTCFHVSGRPLGIEFPAHSVLHAFRLLLLPVACSTGCLFSRPLGASGGFWGLSRNIPRRPDT